MRDFAYADRQAFLRPGRPVLGDAVAGYLLSALMGAIVALVLVGASQ